jgi:HD superfamily phosphohydrolase
MKKRFVDWYLEMLGYNNIPSFLEKYLVVPSLVRLKNIGYFCGMDYASKDIYDFKDKISRYDHSLSVALITWMLTNDEKATLAGLFHDISTPCFSHVIDYMNKDYLKQESTEEKTEEIIMNDKYLLECLDKDNISVIDIIDFKKYSVVDLDRPMMCVDRLDGVILIGYAWTKNLDIDDIISIILNLEVNKNEFEQDEICFKDIDIAKLVLENNELIDIYCHSKEDNYMMELLAKITRRAMDIEIISYDSIYLLNEEEIFEIFWNSCDRELISLLEKFQNIKLNEIDNIDIPNAKVRYLEPIVKGKRLKR